MKTIIHKKWFSILGMFACILILSGCSTPVVTSTKVNDSKTSNRVKCTITMVDFQKPSNEILKELWEKDPTETVIWNKEKVDALLKLSKGKPDVKIEEFPPLIARDGEKVEWNDQKPMKYVSEYNKPDLDKKIYWPTPKTFTTRGVGMKWSILPTIEDQSVSLKLDVEDTVFEEWIEYETNWIVEGKSHKKALPWPVFNERAIHTSLTLKNGQSLLLSGLHNVQTTQEGKEEKVEWSWSGMFLSVTLLDEHGNPIP